MKFDQTRAPRLYEAQANLASVKGEAYSERIATLTAAFVQAAKLQEAIVDGERDIALFLSTSLLATVGSMIENSERRDVETFIELLASDVSDQLRKCGA